MVQTQYQLSTVQVTNIQNNHSWFKSVWSSIRFIKRICVCNQFCFSTVSVINGKNNSVFKTIKVGLSPYGAAFDSLNGYVYVTNQFSNTVSVINGSSNKVFKNITVGSPTYGAAFDSLNGYVYVTNQFSNTVSVINGSSNKVFKNITVGSNPDGAVLDSSNGYVYVMNSGSDTVSVINGSSNKVFKNITVGSNPDGAAFDSSNGYVYVTNYLSGSISILSTFNEYSVTFKESGLPPESTWTLAFNNAEYTLTNTSYTFHVTNGSYTYNISTTDKIYHADGGSFKVNGSPVSENITFSKVLSTLTFTESNLPAGSRWILTFNNVKYTLTNTSYTFHLTNGSYSYHATSTDYMNISGSVSVKGTDQQINLSFKLQTYTVTFKDSNLPKGSTWYVNLSNGMKSGAITGPSYSFSLSNGSYIYTISPANKIYHADGGSFQVNGIISNNDISVSFSKVLYSVTFTESNLPAGSRWILTFNNVKYTLTNTSYTFHEINGTYFYHATSTDYMNISGYVSVKGSAKQIDFSFKLQTYSVTFKESGLQSGSMWYVNLSNGVKSGPITGSSYSFTITNGSYSYTIGNTSGYETSNSTGTMSVNGKNVTENITFSKVTSNTDLYIIIGAASAAVIVAVAAVVIWRRK
ncbi:MAG: hypothetical protein AMDU5_GPLC00014G0127 [Thermoplasmatales archaeon Gpl]|nr:MAG: hypothetical protein AMDU5_GPLC00014G0127 [Thermoplasmatales archaeon Gpl]